MSFVDDQARALELAAVEPYTNEAMTEDLAFYPRLGFVEVDRRTEEGFRPVPANITGRSPPPAAA